MYIPVSPSSSRMGIGSSSGEKTHSSRRSSPGLTTAHGRASAAAVTSVSDALMASHARSNGSARSLSSVLDGEGGRVIPPPTPAAAMPLKALVGEVSLEPASSRGVCEPLGVPGCDLSAWTGERGGRERERAVVGDLLSVGEGTPTLVGEREGSLRWETGLVDSGLGSAASSPSPGGGGWGREEDPLALEAEAPASALALSALALALAFGGSLVTPGGSHGSNGGAVYTRT